MRLPDDPQSAKEPEATPIADLILELSMPTIIDEAGARRAEAVARLECRLPGKEPVTSQPFRFRAPLGAIEDGELSWYLERYVHWPVGVFRDRALEVGRALPEWGQQLFEAALSAKSAREPFDTWRRASRGLECRFSVFVDRNLIEGSADEQRQEANEAATALLSLPWELIHDDRGYLFLGRHSSARTGCAGRIDAALSCPFRARGGVGLPDTQGVAAGLACCAPLGQRAVRGTESVAGAEAIRSAYHVAVW